MIEVFDLFYNTPARRKFMKSEATESRYLSRTGTALAMSRPDIGFSFSLNGRNLFSLPEQQSLKDRVSGLLAPGKDFIEVGGEAGALRVSGFISPPDLSQHNRMGQIYFI